MYPFDADDEALIGICTWPKDEPGLMTRYFRPVKVVANDRKAGRLVILDEYGRYDSLVWSRDEGGYCGGELVPVDDRYPPTADVAYVMARAGNHPDQMCNVCQSRRANWLRHGDHDEPDVQYCDKCVTETSRDVEPLAAVVG